METRETKLGLMFNIRTPWNCENPKAVLWIRASDIIGIQSWIDTDYMSRKAIASGDYMSRDAKICYGIRVAFTVGKGINGTDSTIQVTEDTFRAVAEYIGIPVDE